MTQLTKKMWVRQDEKFPVFYEVFDRPDTEFDKELEVDVSFLARWRAVESDYNDVMSELKKLFNA